MHTSCYWVLDLQCVLFIFAKIIGIQDCLHVHYFGRRVVYFDQLLGAQHTQSVVCLISSWVLDIHGYLITIKLLMNKIMFYHNLILYRLDAGAESSTSRKVFFPDKMTFTLASKEEGGGQRFRCAKIVKQTNKEVLLETFTQSQCYRKVLKLLRYHFETFFGNLSIVLETIYWTG